jgi:hypothetical protein
LIFLKANAKWCGIQGGVLSMYVVKNLFGIVMHTQVCKMLLKGAA